VCRRRDYLTRAHIRVPFDGEINSLKVESCQREGQDSRRGGPRTPVKIITGKTSCFRLVGNFSDKFPTRGSLAWQPAHSHEHSPSPTKTWPIPRGATSAHKLFRYDAGGACSPCHASAPAGGTRRRSTLTEVLMQLCSAARCDRTAQNNSVLSPKPIHVAIKQY
jgi:hypothetical protein